MILRGRVIFVCSLLITAVTFLSCLYTISWFNARAGGVNLFDAIERGDLAAIDSYARAGGDPNCRSWDRMTPLYIAFVESKGDVFKKLLELGADPNVIMRGGRVITHHAAGSEEPYWLKLVLDHGADPNLVNVGAAARSKGTPLYWAVSTGAFENITSLVEHGADINYVTESGTPLLIDALYNARFDVVLYFLERGADYNVSRATHITQDDGSIAPYSEAFIDIVKSRDASSYQIARDREDLEAIRAWLRERGVALDD